MTLKPKWTSESVGEYERSLKPIEQPRVRTGNCLRVGVCASEGHKIAPQRTWVGLTEDDKVLIKHDANYNQFMTAGEYADRVQALTEARLKDKNT